MTLSSVPSSCRCLTRYSVHLNSLLLRGAVSWWMFCWLTTTNLAVAGSPTGSGPNSTVGVVDLAGMPADPFRSGHRVVVLVFVSNDCPISNRYTPEIRRLNLKFRDRGVDFWLVHPDPEEGPEAILSHDKVYPTGVASIRDPLQVLARRAQATVTPESAVFDKDGRLAYRGRIDDRYVDFGKQRPTATRHDLEQALEEVLSGQPVRTPVTRAIGCYIPKPL